jgi:glycosyltransferase involved in cell wall biosynthesis
VYNGASTLRQSLDSILAHTGRKLELLVIDDASNDGSDLIIREYASRDSRITALRNETNIGLAATLNRGLEQARFELVARMDQDDESLPGRLERQVSFMSEHRGIVAAGSFVFNMGRTRRHDRIVRLPVTPRDIARTLPRENCLYHPSVVLRRSPVLEAGGYRAEFRNAEDYELWLRLSRRYDLANIPIPLLRYRLSPGGMTLARKWEQLYYVSLAQQVFRDPALSSAEAARRASAELAHVDRPFFMEQVAIQNVSELARLELWGDAMKVLRSFRHELRPMVRLSLAAAILKARVKR